MSIQGVSWQLVDWSTVTILGLPQLQFSIFPFKVVPFQVQSLGPASVPLLETSLKLHFVMPSSTACDSAWISPVLSYLHPSNKDKKKDVVIVFGFNVFGPFTQKVGFVSGFYSVDGTQILHSVLLV